MALSNASPVRIRPIRDDDTDRLRAHHAGLSAETRYRRFLSVKPSLTSADVRYLVEIDGCDHVAFVATTGAVTDAPVATAGAAATGATTAVADATATTKAAEVTTADGERILGVARFIRLPRDRDVAEMAVVVADEMQRTGLGTELVAHLAQAAVARGVRRFQATMFTQNIGMRRLLENLADGPADYRTIDGLTEMEVRLPGAQDAGPDCGAAPALAA